MSHNVSDAELERYLRRRDPLSSEYAALGREEPSPELDALVLARASAALDEDAGSANWRRRRWPALTALAATVVLSFAIITRITIDGDQAAFAPMPASAPASSSEPAAPATVSSQGAEAIGAPLAAPQAAVPEAGLLEGVAPATNARDEQIGGVAGANERQLMKRQKTEAFAPAGEDAATRADKALAGSATASPAERLADEGSPSVFQTYEALRAEQRARESEQAEREITVTGSRVLTERVRSRPSSPPETLEGKVAPASYEAATAQSAPAVPATSAPAQAARQRDPMEWLKEIQELRAAGRNEEADRELALFRSVYPQIRAVYEVDGAAAGDGVAAENEGAGAQNAAPPRPPTK